LNLSKNVGSILAAVFLAGVLLLYMCTFQVKFTEVAIVKTWGKPADMPITTPGLKFKWPYPIQQAELYDKRTRIMLDRTEETRTEDGKNLLLTTYTLWRIKDSEAARFHRNFPDGVAAGENRLRSSIVTRKHEVVGQRSMPEFISIDPAERKLRDIEQEIMQLVKRDVESEYGMEVLDFGIKKLSLPQAATTDVFAKMKEHEQTKGVRYSSEGQAEAERILSEADAVKRRILAAAGQKANEIENEANRVVSEYYNEFAKYPELRIFLDQVRAIIETFRTRSTIILNTEQPPLDLWNRAGRAKFVPGGAPLIVNDLSSLPAPTSEPKTP
jgi:membrane protease subunit HflC